jgi:hypothetical protein
MILNLVNPHDISLELLENLTSFILSGGQVQKQGLKERISKAKLIAIESLETPKCRIRNYIPLSLDT